MNRGQCAGRSGNTVFYMKQVNVVSMIWSGLLSSERIPARAGNISRVKRSGLSRTVEVFLLLITMGAFFNGNCRAQTADKQGLHGKNHDFSAASEQNVTIRVLLSKENELCVDCTQGSYSFREANRNQELLSGPAGQTSWVRRDKGTWQVADAAGNRLLSIGNDSGDTLEIVASQSGLLLVGQNPPRPYRGKLRCVDISGPDSVNLFAVVNVVDLEEYLEGVVGAEMPSYWYSSALRAQAVACRTYALYQMHQSTGSKNWDVSHTQTSQVYGGVAAEHPRVKEAVSQTRGVVLAHGTPGQEKIFPAYYSSACGGHTSDASAVFGERLPPLAGGPCRYCGILAPQEYNRWPTWTISKDVLSERLQGRYPLLGGLNNIIDIRVMGRSEYGRVEKIELTGSGGQKFQVDAESFRLAVSTQQKPLLSSWYELTDDGDTWRFENGHGWGHGVGMCQYGSEQMARLGFDSVAILSYYYPQAVLLRAY